MLLYKAIEPLIAIMKSQAPRCEYGMDVRLSPPPAKVGAGILAHAHLKFL